MLAALAATALLAGCSQSTGSGADTDPAIVEALTEYFAVESVDADAASCMAEASARIIPADSLEAAGLPERKYAGDGDLFVALALDEAAVSELTDAAFECVDLATLLLGSPAESGVTEAQFSCVSAGLESDETIRQATASGFAGETSADAEELAMEALGAMLSIGENCGIENPMSDTPTP